MGPEFNDMTYQVLFAFFQLVILAFILERGLYFLFDYTKWRDQINGKGIKAPITLAVSWFICFHHDFDIIARTIDPGAETPIGIFITATIVAGGSAAAMTLFHDVLKFTRAARADMKTENQNQS